MVLSGHCLRAKSHGNESASLESPGTMITNWFESKFFRVFGSLPFFSRLSICRRSAEKKISTGAPSSPRKAAGRAEIEFYLCLDCA